MLQCISPAEVQLSIHATMPLPGRLPYGPNTHSVRQFLVRLAALGTVQRGEVVTAYAALAESASWLRADARLGRAIQSSGRGDVEQTLAGPLLQLVTSREAEGGSLDAIAEPALAALLAIVVADLLSEADFATLYRPFAQIIPQDDLQLDLS